MSELYNDFDEKRFIDIFTEVLKRSGLKFRMKEPDEEGGFFYQENGKKKKFDENIFVKRSMKYDSADTSPMISANDILADGNEVEPVSVDEKHYNLEGIQDNRSCKKSRPSEDAEGIAVSVSLDSALIEQQMLCSFDSSLSIFFEAA